VPKADFVFAAGQVSSDTPMTISIPNYVSQMYTSTVTPTGYKRMVPLELISKWVFQYNKKVTDYEGAKTAYDAKVKNFNILHAPVAAKLAMPDTFDADSTALIEGL
jgi:hypothetical protein